MLECRENMQKNDLALQYLPSLLEFYVDVGVIIDRHEVLERLIYLINSRKAHQYFYTSGSAYAISVGRHHRPKR